MKIVADITETALDKQTVSEPTATQETTQEAAQTTKIPMTNVSANENAKAITRQVYLDIAKGIGIILVVWAHACGPFTKYIEGFHMPFFFFISGMLYTNQKRTLKEYAMGKMKSLLAPFWWWNFLLYPVFFVLYYWRNWSASTALFQLGEIVLTLNKVPFLGATWFLPALFFVSVLVHAFSKSIRNPKHTDIALTVISIAIAIFGFEVTLPYRISRVLICGMFYVAGYLYQKYLREKITLRKGAAVAIVGMIFYVIITRNNSSSLSANKYENKLLFVIGALLAIYFILWLSELLSRVDLFGRFNEHLAYLGRNTIDIVIWHFLAFRFAIVLQILVMGIGLKSLTAFPVYDAAGIWWAVYLIAGMYGSLAWKYILEHNPLTSAMRRLYMIR